MKQVQRGFTLIELVMVIVILGVLAAVAIPKFVDLKGDAAQAAVNGVAGGMSSAAAINYAARSLGTATTTGAAAKAVVKCGDVDQLLVGGALPANFTNTDTATTVAAGSSVACTLTGPTTDGGKTASFTAIGIL